ncbi:MAG: hypothetical protein II897_04080 [Clostridia bacterium]|nr:hypothetical protein [Clostridia bacterium]
MFEIKLATDAEKLYAYTQSMQIASQTGCLGHLRAYFSETTLYHDWFDQRADLKTDEFKALFNDIVNELKNSNGFNRLLSARAKVASFCIIKGGDIFRFDVDKYAFIMRLNSNPGDYNVYIYVYVAEWLDNHMKEAENGIRFIDPRYSDLFRLKDGSQIRLTYHDGKSVVRVCRYIDNYHVEIGSNTYHICEFAEFIEHEKATVDAATSDIIHA